MVPSNLMMELRRSAAPRAVRDCLGGGYSSQGATAMKRCISAKVPAFLIPRPVGAMSA